jgi:hypothetical protein
MSWIMGSWRGFVRQKLSSGRPAGCGSGGSGCRWRRVVVEGCVVHLPAREAAILEVLRRNPGRVVSVRELSGRSVSSRTAVRTCRAVGPVSCLPTGHQPAACAVGGIRGECRILLHADGLPEERPPNL